MYDDIHIQIFHVRRRAEHVRRPHLLSDLGHVCMTMNIIVCMITCVSMIVRACMSVNMFGGSPKTYVSARKYIYIHMNTHIKRTLRPESSRVSGFGFRVARQTSRLQLSRAPKLVFLRNQEALVLDSLPPPGIRHWSKPCPEALEWRTAAAFGASLESSLSRMFQLRSSLEFRGGPAIFGD